MIIDAGAVVVYVGRYITSDALKHADPLRSQVHLSFLVETDKGAAATLLALIILNQATGSVRCLPVPPHTDADLHVGHLESTTLHSPPGRLQSLTLYLVLIGLLIKRIHLGSAQQLAVIPPRCYFVVSVVSLVLVD